MRQHSFAVGETVSYLPGQGDGSAVPGRFTVVSRMPPLGTELQYRVKSALDGHERMVRESQLTASARTAPAPLFA